MSEEVLRAGEAARRRRKGNRAREHNKTHGKFNEIETQRGSIVTPNVPAATMPSSTTWFSIMLSRPLTRNLSPMEKFNMYCGLIYLAISVASLMAPGVAADLFSMPMNKSTEGYSRLGGVNFLTIALCYIIASRSTPRNVPAKRILLGTVFERLIYLNLAMVLVYLKHGGHLLFSATLMGMDTVFASITFVLWVRETSGASLLSFPWALKKVIQLLPPSCEPTARRSSAACQILGYLQSFIGTVFLISPDLAKELFQLNSFEGYSKFLLGTSFIAFSITGILHIFAGAADCLSFNILAVFMRVGLTVPLTCMLAALGQIEIGLAGLFAGYDLFAAIIIGIFLSLEGLDHKQQ